MLAIIGSLMNTFIKPVVYAEVGYDERDGGKIQDPLEGVGFFGRPETVLVLCLAGAASLVVGIRAMAVAIVLIAVCTNLSAVRGVSTFTEGSPDLTPVDLDEVVGRSARAPGSV